MVRNKIPTMIATALTITSCCMLFSACERDHFASLKDTAFVGEELTLNTYGKLGQATGTLTIGNKNYFVGIHNDGYDIFVMWDLSDFTELQNEDSGKWYWRLYTTLVDKTEKRIYEHQVELFTKEGDLRDREPVFPIWNGNYKNDGGSAFRKTTYIEFTIDEDLLSEREGTPSYAGKTIRLERQK